MKTVQFELDKVLPETGYYCTCCKNSEIDHSGTYVLLTEAEAEIAALREQLDGSPHSYIRQLKERIEGHVEENQALREQVDELSNVHTGEGTFICTCTSYPHSPDCGIDARIVALREQLLAEQKSVNELSLANQDLHERQRVLVNSLDRVTAYYEGCLNGVTTDNYQDVIDEARAALAAKEG